MSKIGLRYYDLSSATDQPVSALTVRISGEVYDINTLRPIAGVIVTMLDNSGNKISAPFKLPGSTYDAWTEEAPGSVFLLFEKTGYADQLLPFTELQNNSSVMLAPKPGGNIGLLMAVFGALLLFAKKKKRRVGKITTGDVIPFMLLAGGLLGFSTIRKFLEMLGFWNSAATKGLNAAAEDPGSFWSPLYWRNKPDSIRFTYTINQATAERYSEEIYDSFGPFNDCEECAVAVFKRLRTKANVSYLADVFQAKYGEDLLKFLRGGWWPQDRLSDADVFEINEYLEKLPNY